jgi:predicted transcriptional regulator
MKLDFEDVFSSKTRMKILKLLFKLGQLHASDVARRIGMNYESTVKHLAILEEESLVEHRVSGRVRFFRFANSVKARATVKLLEDWDR